MRWILAGFCGFALVSLSVALQVIQKPRYYGLRTGEKSAIYCLNRNIPNAKVSWFKTDEYSPDMNKRQELQKNDRIRLSEDRKNNSILFISSVQKEDSGVYYCKINEEWGPGTEVRVVRYLNMSMAQYRSQMKDGLMVLQGLMLALCVAAILLRKQKLTSRMDSEYEEPETDHIYEGLAIETCGGGLYEDLTAYTHVDGAEAPWE